MYEVVQARLVDSTDCKQVVSDLREDTAVIRQSAQCLKGKLDDLCVLAGLESQTFTGGGSDSELQHALKISLKECVEAREERKRVRCLLMRVIPKGHFIQDAIADGNCLFRAFCIGYNVLMTPGLSHEVARTSCVNTIRTSFSDRFADFDRDVYLGEMAQLGTYGDELCIAALSRHFEIKVCVYHPFHPLSVWGDCYGDSRVVNLAYNGSNHFDAILAKPSQGNSASNMQSSPDEASCSGELCILSVNVTSWQKHALSLLTSGPDVLLLQETRLSAKGHRAESTSLSAHSPPWHAVWGPPMDPMRIKGKTQAKGLSDKGAHGGVAIVSKSAIPLVPTGLDSFSSQALLDSKRWVTAAIPMGLTGGLSCRCLHLVSFYGISNKGYGSRFTANERLIQHLFDHVSQIGEQPVVIGLDANTSPEASPSLARALGTGRFLDLAVHFCDSNPAPTFCASPTWDKHSTGVGITRPDLVICNLSALPLIKRFVVRRDLSVCSHVGLQIVLHRHQSTQHFRAFKPPPPFPMSLAPRISQDAKSDLFAKCLGQRQHELDVALSARDTDTAWLALANVAEDFLAHRCGSSSCQKGRHRSPTFVQRTMSASASSKFCPDVASTARLRKLYAALRRLRELEFKLVRFRSGAFSAQDRLDCEQLWSRLSPVLLSCAIAFPDAWQDSDPPVLHASLCACIDAFAAEDRKRRLKHWRLKLRESLDLEQGRIAYQWLNSQQISPLRAVRNDDGSLATSTCELLEAVMNSWQKIFNKDSCADVQAFLEKVSPLLPVNECSIPALTGCDLQQQVLKCKVSRAVALDGWRVSELHDLPVEFYDVVASIFSLVESGSPWPTSCVQGHVSMIPKAGDSDLVDQIAPGDLIVSDGLATRPITVLSPLYCSYSSLRFKQLSRWRESWLLDSMHGGRANHEVYDCSYALAADLEASIVQHSCVAGIALDRKKFFDLLEYEIGHCLLQYLGCPIPIICAARKFYSQLSCRYKVNTAFSLPCSRQNGFAQGDSYSLQVALAIMAAWSCYMQSHAPSDVDLTLGSFLDDSHFYVKSCLVDRTCQGLWDLWLISASFDNLAGTVTNFDKSFFFANSGKLQSAVEDAMEHVSEPLRLKGVSSFKLVGSMIAAHVKPGVKQRNKRVSTSCSRLHKLRYAPARFKHRLRMSAASPLPCAVFGTELQDLTQGQKTQLRTAVSNVLWRGKTWCRSAATTFTLIAPGHLLHPRQACIWQAFTVARRLLARRHDIRASFVATWEAIQHDASVVKRLWGPVRRLHQAVIELRATWREPFCIITEHNVRLHLFQGSSLQWKHDLRHALRTMVWVSDRAFLNRLDMQGAGVIAYDATVSLLRRSERPKRQKRYKQSAPLSLFEQTHLRAILTGAVRTSEKLFKAQSCASPNCVHCGRDVIESVEHLFWHCPAWDQLRASFLHNFGNHLANAPSCTKCCGILPQDVVDRLNWSQREAVIFCENLQMCMVSILCAREKTLRKISCQVAGQVNPEAESRAAQSFSNRERLYPGYPWTFELVEGNCAVFFQGVPPRNWRVYKRGSSWSFGVQLFEPLIFYSSFMATK